MNRIDLMERYEEYYVKHDKEIMTKLEKKLNDTQTQINNNSDLTKANELYQETIDYLTKYDTKYWEQLSEPAYLDYQKAIHKLTKPRIDYDKIYCDKWIAEHPDELEISPSEAQAFFEPCCLAGRTRHNFHLGCLKSHLIAVTQHVEENRRIQRRQEEDERKQQTKLSNIMNDLGL
ncbi:TPA: hypothetical protein P4P41_002503 [Enterococcus faecium]|nr:hypothetical protein [Enterococcus faecium]EME7210169.1 hypothetical protein [Enterococcus faecium]HDO7719107.1 hypothetical protein [Enterococcus faecium]HDO7779575.1 hypothetical protein [Enterococcus faecium]